MKLIMKLISIFLLVLLFTSEFFLAKGAYNKIGPFVYHVVLFLAATILYYNFPGGFENNFHRPDTDKPPTPVECAYFSLTTHTTTGYGDIYPLTDIARTTVMTHMILVFLGIASLLVV